MTSSRASHLHVSYTCLRKFRVSPLPPTIPAPNPLNRLATPLTQHQKPTKSQTTQLKGVPFIGSPHYTSTAFASLPFPSRPGISIPIDSRSEGFLMAENQNPSRRSLRIQEKRAIQNRRMSFMIIVRHPAMIARHDVM
jgi:hypothetical protein